MDSSNMQLDFNDFNLLNAMMAKKNEAEQNMINFDMLKKQRKLNDMNKDIKQYISITSSCDAPIKTNNVVRSKA